MTGYIIYLGSVVKVWYKSDSGPDLSTPTGYRVTVRGAEVIADWRR